MNTKNQTMKFYVAYISFFFLFFKFLIEFFKTLFLFDKTKSINGPEIISIKIRYFISERILVWYYENITNTSSCSVDLS